MAGKEDLQVNKKGLVPVRFKLPYKMYNKGEIAGFTPSKAKELLDMKAVDLVKVSSHNKMQKASV